ncbi:MAG: Lrp/AsnC family transcriptional regulator [Thermoplasmatota archaeon]
MKGDNEESITKLILRELKRNPRRSDKKIAEDLDTYRQKVWRKRKNLEEREIIWGYSAICNEFNRGYDYYAILLSLKRLNKELAELLMERDIKYQQHKNNSVMENVRIIDSYYVTGRYDWLVIIYSPDKESARRYYDRLRFVYEKYLLEKPLMLDINFITLKQEKLNPKIRNFMDFVPEEKIY